MKGRYISKLATLTVDGDSDGLLEADADAAVVDVSDLEGISIYLDQIVDNGNVTLTVEKTVDGTNFALVDTKNQDDFPGGANKSVELTLSDANGMATRAKAIKVTVSGHTGTGSYTVHAAGSLVPGL